MSRHLVKILSICALVVLMAVTIVGAAIGVTEAVGCTLTIVDASVASDAEKENQGSAHKVVVKVNGKVQDKDVLTVGKYSEITLEYQATGYDFKGWYVGNYDVEVDKAAETKVTYKFDLKGDTKISAVADLKKFTVNYTGTLADGTGSVGSIINPTTQIVEYGEVLPKPATNSEDQYFLGWKIKDAEGELAGKTYYYATFENVADPANVVLEAAWGAQEYVTYTVRVAYNVLQPENITTLEYNTKTGFNKSYYGEVTRSGYTLKGIKFNDTLYEYNKDNDTFVGLGEAIALNTDTTVNAVAVWDCNFGSYTFKINAMSHYVDSELGDGDWGVIAKRNGANAQVQDSVQAKFDDIEAEDYFDLEDDIYKLFITDRYTDFTTLDGDSVSYNGKIKISVGAYNTEFNVGNEVTFKDILVFVTSPSQLPTLANGATISITFMYA